MALIQMSMFSKCLMRTVPVTCILPFDNTRFEDEDTRPAALPYKTLYLLNGMFGSELDWIIGSGIMLEAQDRNLAVVMPAGENHWYVDNAEGGLPYGRFVGEELVSMTRRAFHLSDKREDTYIAGLSMGGYGAIINGLRFGDTFGYVAGLSNGLNLAQIAVADESNINPLLRGSYLRSVFGDPSQLIGSDKDPKALYLSRKAQGAQIPKLYMGCGTEDFLLDYNRDYRDFLIANGADLVYEEGPGSHDYRFWSEYIVRVLKWLPLEDAVKPLGSGNVR